MENYKIVKPLGKGSYGQVYEAVHIVTGRIVALKKTHLTRDGIPRSTIREIALLKAVESPYVVKILDFFLATENNEELVCMAMERSECDLLAFMQNTFGCRSPVPADIAKHFCYQILLGLQHCHANSIMHRDLKPANVLVHQIPPTGFQLKIADFGIGRQLSFPNPSYKFRCTRWYRAPEILLGTVVDTTAVDVWAVGCIFVQMLLGDPPFKGASQLETLIAIFSVLGTPDTTSWPGVEELFNWHIYPQWEPKHLGNAFGWPQDGIPNHLAIDLMGKMLVLNPTERITCLNALMHPYFNDIRGNYISPVQAHKT